jgi:3-deoxy-D-manno-octulosonic-acid transferase
MIWLYRLCFVPALVLALPYYGWRMWRRGGYRRDFAHRFGALGKVPPKAPGKVRIWLQAVSVGELLAIDPLLRRLDASGAFEVVLTTTTSTGRRIAEEKYAEFTVWRGIFPLDWWWFSARAWKQIRPDQVMLMESELWPEHLHQAARHGLRPLLLNARLSDTSFRRYQKMRVLARPLLRPLGTILTSSEQDTERFAALKLPDTTIETMGNLKFDVPLPSPLSDEERAALRTEIGLEPGDRVLLGASTWPGEETALVETVKAARREGLPVKALIVPRHAERRRELEEPLRALGLPMHWRTDGRQAPAGTLVYLADTTGELSRLVQLGDIVFIGKTLPPHREGQTPIEAAGYGKAILLGPGTASFRQIVRLLVAHGGARRVANATELRTAVLELLRAPEQRTEMEAIAAQTHAASRGALQRVWTHFEAWSQAAPAKNLRGD